MYNHKQCGAWFNTNQQGGGQTEAVEVLQKLRRNCIALIFDEDGLTTVEYALLLGIFVVAGIGIWVEFGGRVQQAVDESSNSFDAAEGSG